MLSLCLQEDKKVLTDKRGTRRGLYSAFKEAIHKWALRYYVYKWNDAQADAVLRNLQPGQMVSFWDFSENYEHVHQDDIQVASNARCTVDSSLLDSVNTTAISKQLC